MSDPKTDQALTIAREAVDDIFPGLLSLSTLADRVAAEVGISAPTARRRIRAAVEDGNLYELKPNRLWRLQIPGSQAAGIGDAYVVGRAHHYALESSGSSPSAYGPGALSFVMTPERAAEIVHEWADAKKAKADAENETREREAREEHREINRRAPGLIRLMRRLNLLTYSLDDESFTEMQVRLGRREYGPKKDTSPDAWPLDITARARGNDSANVLHAILEAGLAAYIEAQPDIACKHCGNRILRTEDRRGVWWWHADSTNATCAKDSETKAEPAI